jgi:SNF2 family DNA or RNA helicase
MQPRTGGYGLTLTAATVMIYHDNDWSLEVRQQSEDRAHRMGQKSVVTYIDLVAEGTVDEQIREALVEKRDLADKVTGDKLRQMLML